MQNKLISIIVPIFNAEKYLDDCINSVLLQTYKYWELILISDGSTDNTNAICNKYAIIDSRIHYIQKENTGVSDTRNIGLEIAKGYYIMFLDADDYWCTQETLETLINTTSKYNIDILRGDFKRVEMNSTNVCSINSNKNKLKYANKIIDSYTFLDKIINGEYFLFTSFFKKQVFSKIRFSSEMIFLEDMDLMIRLLLCEMKCMYIPYIFYDYRTNILGASHNHTIKNLNNSFNMCYHFRRYSLQAKNKKIQKHCEETSILMYYYTLCTIAEIDNYYYFKKEIIKELQLNKLHKDIKVWIKEYKYITYNMVFYLSPIISIRILRIWIKSKIKCYQFSKKLYG